MRLTDFNYHLPDELIARYPSLQRTDSRLLCLNRATGAIVHRRFCDLIDLVNPGDLLILNNTKVIPARLFGCKASGGQVEILIEKILDSQRAMAHVRASKALRADGEIFLKDSEIVLKVISRQDDLFELQFPANKDVLTVLNEYGHMPLPPYMDRADEELDKERYQTVYAQHPGAVAAPTAGLHFDEMLLRQLQDKNIDMDFVTLHVGAGTFQPVRTENITEHVMHSEYAEIPAQVCEKIKSTKASNNRVIAVGTTSVRCLETAARNGVIRPFQGDTDIFIYPGFQFNCVDAMVTNFHLPQSTLLMLVSAFASREKIMAAYQTAIEERYRFFSYGDAMWIGK